MRQWQIKIARRFVQTVMIVMVAVTGVAANNAHADGEAARAIQDKKSSILKTRENGVTVWRLAPKPKPRLIPQLLGAEETTAPAVKEVKVVINDQNAGFVVSRLRVSGFYSGRGRSTNPVRGFYSGKRRKKPSTVQGFYSGYKHAKRNRFPTERPNGNRTPSARRLK